MELWTCVLCGCSDAEELFRTTVPQLSHARLTMVQCTQCGLRSLNPRPARHQLAALYQGNYEPFWDAIEEDPNRLRRWTRQRFLTERISSIRALAPSVSLALDLGCATGILAHRLRYEGVRVIGSDISIEALTIAERQRVPVWCGESDMLAAQSSMFDLLMMWEVIEHTPDPRATLLEAWRVLRPGGVLLLSTPNAASLQSRLWGANWSGWQIPYHLQVFTPSTLAELLQQANFTTIRRVAFPHEHFYAAASLRATINKWPGVNLITRFTLAGLPLFRLIDHLPIASSLVMIARRPL